MGDWPLQISSSPCLSSCLQLTPHAPNVDLRALQWIHLSEWEPSLGHPCPWPWVDAQDVRARELQLAGAEPAQLWWQSRYFPGEWKCFADCLVMSRDKGIVSTLALWVVPLGQQAMLTGDFLLGFLLSLNLDFFLSCSFFHSLCPPLLSMKFSVDKSSSQSSCLYLSNAGITIPAFSPFSMWVIPRGLFLLGLHPWELLADHVYILLSTVLALRS